MLLLRTSSLFGSPSQGLTCSKNKVLMLTAKHWSLAPRGTHLKCVSQLLPTVVSCVIPTGAVSESLLPSRREISAKSFQDLFLTEAFHTRRKISEFVSLFNFESLLQSYCKPTTETVSRVNISVSSLNKICRFVRHSCSEHKFLQLIVSPSCFASLFCFLSLPRGLLRDVMLCKTQVVPESASLCLQHRSYWTSINLPFIRHTCSEDACFSLLPDLCFGFF